MLIIAATVHALIICTSFAATEQWTIKDAQLITQIMADGSGGGAFVCRDASNNCRLVWFDKQGRELYRAAPTNAFPWPIVTCTKKTLLYMDKRPLNVFVQVTPNGTESVITDAGASIGPSLIGVYGSSIINDSKGFFALKFFAAGSSNELLRFSNK
jgi:hypothetical protein